MPANSDTILTKLEALQLTIHNVEKLQIKVHQQIKTINERGCIKGELMNNELEQKLMKEINFISKMIKVVSGLSAAIGTYLTVKR